MSNEKLVVSLAEIAKAAQEFPNTANQSIGYQQSQNSACRSTAQELVADIVRKKRSSLAAWEWISHTMTVVPPNSDEEASLHALFCAVHRDLR